MKVKIIKYPGYFRLVCDDETINKKYHCTQENPIELANLSTWEDSCCWKLRDMRLENSFYPSEHLEGSNLQRYTPIDEEDAKNLKSKLKYFKETPEGEIKWGTFSGVVGIGDRTDHPDNPSWIAQSIEGCWSFNAARTKFKEIRAFWKAFEGDELKSSMMHNPNEQITSFDYKSQRDYSNKPLSSIKKRKK